MAILPALDGKSLVNFGPLIDFFGKPYLHVPENDQVLLAHPPLKTGVPITIFFQRGSTIGIKFDKRAPSTLAVVGKAT